MQITKFTIMSLILFVLSSCSFRSTQYDFLRQILVANQEDKPTPGWVIEWSGLMYDAYAINHQGTIYFVTANEHLIGFRDKGIFQVRGFNAIATEIKIELSNNRVIFNSDNEVKRIDYCDPWEKKSDSENNIQFENQVCFAAGSDYNQYENSIYYNKDKIIGLRFKIHPEYPAIKLRSKSSSITLSDK